MATRYTFTVRTPRGAKDVKSIVSKIPGYLSGRLPDVAGIGRAFKLQYAAHLFEKIHIGFMQKSTGRADELGNRWKPLAPSTIEAKLSTIRKHGPKRRSKEGKQLTLTQKKIYDTVYAHNVKKLTLLMGEKAARQKAGRIARMTVAKQESKKLAGLGYRGLVPILIATGRLERSLRMGTLNSNSYYAPLGQFVRPRRSGVELGSSDPNAGYMHNGTRTVPARKLWPAQMKPWHTYAATEATKSIAETLKRML